MPAFGQTTAIEWYNKGVDLYKEGNYNESIKAYEKAIKINPQDLDAWGNKGLAFDAQGNYSGAINAYDEAIRLDPNDAKAWYNKGLDLKALGNSIAADAAFAKANELASASHPDSIQSTTVKNQATEQKTTASKLFNITASTGNYSIAFDSQDEMNSVYTSGNGNSVRLESRNNLNNEVSLYAFSLNDLDKGKDYREKLTHWWPKIHMYLYNETTGKYPSKEDYVPNATVDGMASYVAVGYNKKGVLCSIAAWPTSDGQSVLGAVISWDSVKPISYILKSIKVNSKQSATVENQANEQNLMVGKLLYSDDFSGTSPEWKTWEDQNASVTYENGKIHIIVSKGHKGARESLPGSQIFGNFIMEVEASKVSGPDRSAYGVILRRTDKESYYRFKISGLGQYGFERNLNGKCTDNSFTAGNIGFEVATAEMGMVHASFDNLSVWAISSEAASPG
jgi:Tfp pilus assembly protein PilF